MDLHACLNRSLNERSRSKKLSRLAFDTSEDAVTWTVFRYLQENQLLGTVFGLTQPRILYWGAEYPARDDGLNLSETLKGILLGLNENPISLSEPDIVLIDDDVIYTIEVKYRSTNSVQRHHRRFEDYLAAAPGVFIDENMVAEAGYYELTRNIVFTRLLAQALNRNWKVINLGMPRIRASATVFRGLLNDPATFKYECWQNVCGRIPAPRDLEFQSYLRRKELE